MNSVAGKNSEDRPKILFLICALLDGGIDSILVEYLDNIDLSRYDVTLGIGVKTDEMEVYLNRLPKGIKIEYLVDQPWLTAWRKERIKKRLPGSLKVIDETFLNPIRRSVSQRRLRELASANDYIFDFDCTFYSMLQGIGKPVTGVYHFSIEESLRHSQRHTMRQMQGMHGYRHIVTICEAMLQEGKRCFPELADKFVMVYNGFNLEKLRKRGEADMPLTVPVEGYFLSVARLEESQKDISSLLKAYSEFLGKMSADGVERSRVPRLWLIGDGKDREMLENLSAKLQIADKVDFLGFQKDPAPFMRNSLALVHSSKFEGFGLAIAEAVIIGKAVISSDCPTGPSEILDFGKAGILVEMGNYKEMADAMFRLASDQDLRERYEKASLVQADKFDVRNSIKALLNLVDAETGSGGARRIKSVSAPCGSEAESNGKVSVVMNTYQAEKYLDRVLASVAWADEIVVVDMHSTDRTVEIAQAHGAKVIFTERANYCEPARNLAIKSASNPWVLVLDADEVVPAALAEYLQGMAARDNGKVRALRIPRRNRFMGREMHSLYPDYVTRFIARDYVDWPKEIHSQPIIEGEIASIPESRKDLALIHLEENTIESRIEKIERYTDFEAQRRGPKKYSAAQKIYKPGMRIVHTLVFKGGWRDGKAGLEWARLEARYKKRTIEKQEEVQKKKK